MAEDAIQLSDQLGVLRRRWRVVVATLLLAVGVGVLIIMLSPKTYVATAQMQLDADPTADSGALTAEQVATEALVVVSSESLQATIDQLGLSETPDDLLDTVSVEPEASGAAVVSITASRESPSEAADIANTLGLTYLEAGGAGDVERLAEVDSRIDEIYDTIARVDGELADTTDPQRRTELLIERRRATAERSLLVDARASIALGQDTGAETGDIVNPASAPSSAASPRPLQTLVLAGVLGLLLGIGLAYLRDYLDDVVRHEGKLGKALGGMPVLGRIPRRRRRERRAPAGTETPESATSQAYRALGANIRFLLSEPSTDGAPASAGRPTSSGPDRQSRGKGLVLLVSSASRSEGRTSTALNLALATARAELNVVLIDAELRRPRLGQLIGLPDGPGLADVLAGTTSSREALFNGQTSTLLVMPAGTLPENATELSAAPELVDLLDDLTDEADLVVIDSPAVLVVADGLDMARHADLTVLAVREDLSRTQDVTEAVHRLEQAGAHVAGVVLTDVGHRRRRPTAATL